EDDSDDELVGVALCTDDQDVFLATRNGKAIRFASTDVRSFTSRTSTGVRAMTLKDGDKVMSLSIIDGDRDADTLEAEDMILTVSQNGYGKQTSSTEYRRIKRGGQGVANIDMTEKTGPVVASFPIENGAQLMLVTDQGKMIRIPTTNVRVTSRATQGVTLFKVAKNEKIVSAAKILEDDDDEEHDGDQGEGGDVVEAPADVIDTELPDGE
ncbi:MAG: DNA gyrase C-terminal beta-propeller domain-containing protein, partial [Pacificimonas sp.]